MPEYSTVPIEELQLAAGNPRRGRVDQIAESLQKHSQYRPIVVNKGTHTGREREVLAGNHTLIAARNLGWTHIDIGLIDVDEEMAKSIIAADNRLGDLGEYDDRALAELLASMDDLTGTGYSEDDRAALLADVADPLPPEDFPTYGDDIETEYTCPKCNYQWSGSPGG